MSKPAKEEVTRIGWKLDYREHLVAQFEQAKAEDREALIAYGTIASTNENEGVITYVVEYADSDGWDARGQVEETAAQIGSHASWERITS